MKHFISVKFILFALSLIFIGSCATEHKMTEEKWQARYKPETLEQGRAMALLTSAKIKAESAAESIEQMSTFKTACAMGFVGSIVALGIGVWLRMKLAAGLGIIGVMACLAGYSLACADKVYSKYIALGGLIFGTIIGGMTIYLLVRAFQEIVIGGELFKKRNANALDFNDAQQLSQSISTQKLVKQVKRKAVKL